MACRRSCFSVGEVSTECVVRGASAGGSSAGRLVTGMVWSGEMETDYRALDGGGDFGQLVGAFDGNAEPPGDQEFREPAEGGGVGVRHRRPRRRSSPARGRGSRRFGRLERADRPRADTNSTTANSFRSRWWPRGGRKMDTRHFCAGADAEFAKDAGEMGFDGAL